jgi:catechol 2,3-dioxygenase-like lactoylglutathione lyase family enzyme
MGAAILALSLASCLAAPGGLRAPVAPALSASGAFFALSVADLDASTAWYERAFGLAVVMRTPPANGASAVVLEGGGLIVELIHQDRAVPLASAAPGTSDRLLVHGLVKAGAIIADFDATLAWLRERHVTIAFGPFPARAGQRANVIIRDNSGNLIQLFGPRP